MRRWYQTEFEYKLSVLDDKSMFYHQIAAAYELGLSAGRTIEACQRTNFPCDIPTRHRSYYLSKHYVKQFKKLVKQQRWEESERRREFEKHQQALKES